MGKLGYLSPEQCFGEPVDQRSDLFSMTVVMAEALTGHRVFVAKSGETDQEVMRRIGEGPRPDFQALNPDLSEAACAMLRRGLSHLATKRFSSAEDMREAIAQFLQPDVGNQLAIAALLRLLFKREFRSTRLRGSPLAF